MIKNSCSVVEKYINEEFMPILYKAIEGREVEKKVEKHMGKVISNNMLIDLLDSTAKNSNIVKKNTKKPEVQQVGQNKRQHEHLKVRMKKDKNKNIQSSIIKFQNNSQYDGHSQRSIKSQHITNNNSMLIKLPELMEQQSEQIRKIRIMKQRMRKFQKQISQRGEDNAYVNSQTQRKKKSVHSQCIYHTYDYQSNIVHVQPQDLYNFYQNKDNYSLLETLKKNLDKNIQDQITREKIKAIQQKSKQVNFTVPSHKIHKVQNKNEQAFKKQKLFPQNNQLLKPSLKFELSYIQSLSNGMDKCIQNGVKMVTNEQKLVDQTLNPQKPNFKVKKQKTVHQKQYSPKQKTNISQSIIYSLECNFKKLNSESESQKGNQYRSLQLQKDERRSQINDYYKPIPKKKMTLQSPSSFDFKLPEIKFNRPAKATHKRNSTEEQQHIIKGIDHIHIKLNTPQNNPARQDRSELFSAYSLNKKTESSVSQYQSEKSSQSGKSKKSLVQQYFNNYGNQFRRKRQKIQNLSNIDV